MLMRISMPYNRRALPGQDRATSWDGPRSMPRNAMRVRCGGNDAES